MLDFDNLSSALDDSKIVNAQRVLIHKVVRVVEAQEQIATLELTDNKLEEQSVLEELLDSSKPAYSSESKHHYLIRSPFRYPPLKNGSRFGIKSRKGIYYSSLSYKTAFAERAYYLFFFLEGMQQLYTEEPYRSQQNTFWVSVHAQKGIALQEAPFDVMADGISHLLNYKLSQNIGSQMRDLGVQAFSFASARDQERGLNLGVFDIDCIRSKQPQNVQSWIVHYDFEDLDNLKLSFFNPLQHKQVFTFERNSFCIDGQFPQPAV